MRVINMRSLVVLVVGLVLGAQAYDQDIQIGIVNPADIPVGCSAALKCTPIEFCTAKGIISNTSVVLSREQQIYRVPLTDCRDLETGVIGKCCRDPYYTDPWPTNQIGQWVPGVFGGDDGKYTKGDLIKEQVRPPTTKAPAIAQQFQIGVGQIASGGGAQVAVVEEKQEAQVAQIGIGQYEIPGEVKQVVKPGETIVVEQGGSAQVAQIGIGQYEIPGEVKQVVKPGETIVVEQGGSAQVAQIGIGQYEIPGEVKQVVKPGETIVVEQGGSAQALQFGVGQYGIAGEEKQIVQPGQTFVVEQGGGGLLVGGGVGQQVIQGFGTAFTQGLYRIFLQAYSAGTQCGLLRNQKPYGDHLSLEADFAQYPWQAMVLEKANKTLRCGGVITRPDVVLTSASCVHGLEPSNILIKGGEWKLGVDEEPLPFQIVQVKHVLYHPFYEHGTYQYDVALLVLDENLRFANNIYPICLPTAEESFEALYAEGGDCVVTGWGKEVLQAHRLGSVIHDLNVTLVQPDECYARINKYYPEFLPYFNKDSSACAQPEDPLQNICSVDIGSALACPTKNGNYVLKGIYSWDSGCRQLGNQIGAFYKFDLEWYQWAIGLIESVRFAQFSKGSLLAGAEGKIKVEGEALGIKQEAVELGQAGLGLFAGQGAGLLSGQNIIYQTKPEIITYTTKPQIITYTTKPQIATYTTKPQIVTYTTKPQIVTYTTKPKIVTYTTKPQIVTYTTKPKIITYTTKPKIITYTTKPEIISYTTKPEVFTYTTKPEIISYASQPELISGGLNVQEGSFIPE